MTLERIEEILERWRRPYWPDLGKLMTPEEKAEVMAVWDDMPGNTCFYDAFMRLRNAAKASG